MIEKKYAMVCVIVLLTLAFFGFVPGLVSAPNVSCYLGLLACILYPYIMYRLIKKLVKIKSKQSK